MKMLGELFIIFILLVNFTNCQDKNNTASDLVPGPAVVTQVSVSGAERNYSFSVTLLSPDTGCEQYADWWEVVSVDGTNLHYRRTLAHSHVSEQPFTRSGGSVNINAGTEVIVRGHMNATGYGDGKIAMKGSVTSGFSVFEIPSGFGANLEKIQPQPNGCAF